LLGISFPGTWKIGEVVMETALLPHALFVAMAHGCPCTFDILKN
jgi:hypothetical protein